MLPQDRDCNLDRSSPDDNEKAFSERNFRIATLEETDRDQQVRSEETAKDVDQKQDTDVDKRANDSDPNEYRGKTFDQRWEEAYARLVEYLNEHQAWPTALKYNPLYAWIRVQRKRRRDGKLPQNRVEQLNSLGVPWSGAIAGIPFRPRSERSGGDGNNNGTVEESEEVTREELRSRAWNEKVRTLVQYLNEHQTWPPPSKEMHLYRWIAEQRGRRERGQLAQNRFERLHALGMPWIGAIAGVPYRPRQQKMTNGDDRTTEERDKVSREELRSRAWDEEFNRLVQHLNEQKKWPTSWNGGPLCSWLSAQRKRKEEGKLPHYQLKKLTELGFAWEGKIDDVPFNPRTIRQEKNTDRSIDDTQNSNHHDQAPSYDVDPTVLPKNDEHHSNDNKQQGNAAVSTRPLEGPRGCWEEQFAKLLVHLNTHKEWPKKSECRSLNNWLTVQRIHKRTNQLSSVDFGRLDNLGFPWEGDLFGVPYCPRRSQSHQRHSSTNKREHEGDGDDRGNQQRQATLLHDNIHPAAIKREGEKPNTPLVRIEANQPDCRNDSATSRKRKRTIPEHNSTSNQPSTDDKSKTSVCDTKVVNQEEGEENNQRKRCWRSTGQRLTDIVPIMARRSSQSNNINESHNISIDDSSLPRQHRQNRAAYPVTDNDTIGSDSEAEGMNENQDDCKVPATTRT